MGKYEPIHKQISLTSDEKRAAMESEKTTGKFAKLPQPLLEFFIRRSLGKMREASLKIELPNVDTQNEIDKNEHTFDAGYGAFSVYSYRRSGLPSGRYPLFYFIHGGGFLGGTYLANENLMKKLADENDIVCASVEYHISPEKRYPAALRECEKGLLDLLKAEDISPFIDESQVYAAGDSAGGNLAASMVLSLKNEHRFAPAGQVLLYPVTNMYELNADSFRRKETEFRSMRKLIRFSRKMYAQSPKDYADIYFSPLLTTAKDDSNPSRALILLAERDGLLSDGVLYGEHLNELGGKVKAIVYDGAFHSFINGLGDSDIAEDAYKEIVGFISGN
jgi:acetyl esterase